MLNLPMVLVLPMPFVLLDNDTIYSFLTITLDTTSYERTNPYTRSLLDVEILASKESMYMLAPPNHKFAYFRVTIVASNFDIAYGWKHASPTREFVLLIDTNLWAWVH